MRALLALLGSVDPGLPVRGFDEKGEVWNLIAAVPLKRGLVALQLRSAAAGPLPPDPFAEFDETLADRLSQDLTTLGHAYRLLEAERDHWVEQLKQAELRLSAIGKIISGT